MEEPVKWSKKLLGLLVCQISSADRDEEKFFNIIKTWRCIKDGNCIQSVFARRGEFSPD